jgi:hypothetical protein
MHCFLSVETFGHLVQIEHRRFVDQNITAITSLDCLLGRTRGYYHKAKKAEDCQLSANPSKRFGLNSERKPQVACRQTAGRDRMLLPFAYLDGARRLYE